MSHPSPRLFAAARTLVGITQRQLASEAKVSQATLKKLERGEANPTSVTIDKIMTALSARGLDFITDRNGNYEGLRMRGSSGNDDLSSMKQS